MSTNNFEYLLGKGKETEKLISDVLTERGFTVTDVSDDKEYQEIDVDFLIRKNNKDDWKLEIKSDSKISKNGNFFLEKGFDRRTGYRKGWLEKCKANYLAMYDSISQVAYILDWEATREYARVNGKHISWWNYSDDCRGYAVLLPVEETKKNGLVVHIYNKEIKEMLTCKEMLADECWN